MTEEIELKELELLQLYGQLHNQHLELDQLKHQFASYDQEGNPEPFGVGETLQALHTLGFEASLKKGLRQNLQAATLPALMPTNDGGLMLVGKMVETADPDGTLVVVQKACLTKSRCRSLTNSLQASGLRRHPA
ncbi:hypothetical protein [Limnohabitans sp.]|uniref:hypothetical protein n=1 Tax=Limnohabitans sp. TaxID=1907725 RepID=UPI00286F529D|nr:hypothetical protein [Limnohabitans sp.]